MSFRIEWLQDPFLLADLFIFFERLAAITLINKQPASLQW
jgi:hypothetical protein